LGWTRFSQVLGVNNHIDPKSLGIDTGPLSPNDFGVPYVYLYHLGYGGYIGGVQGYPIVTQPDQTWDWSEHFSWIKGNHTIRLGGNFQRAYTNSTRNFARSGLTAGYFTYYSEYYGGHPCTPNGSTDLVACDVEELLLGKADFANRSFGDTHRHITQNSVGFYAQDDWKIKPRFTLNYGLRYEINGTMRDTNNLEANFDPARGFLKVGKDISGVHNVDYHDFGPHLGFAWDIFGSGRLALRGGYSLTFDVPNFATLAAPYSFARARTGVFTELNLGFINVSNSSDVGSGLSGASPLPTDPSATCYDPATHTGDYICFNSAVGGPLFGSNPNGVPPFNAFSVPENFRTPRYHNFNLSLQSELFRNNVLTLTYSGQRGRDLVIFQNINSSPVGSPCVSASDCDSLRPLSSLYTDATGEPLLRQVIQATNRATSQYDSLQVSYNQRAWHGLDTQYNFTWSKCFDDNSVNRGGAGDYPQLNNINAVGSTALGVANIKDTRGLCDHDVRLNFNIGGIYSFPTIRPIGERLGGGWQLSTIFTAISGRPFTAILGGSDRSGQGLTGNGIRAAWDGSPVHYNTRNPDNYVVEQYGGTDPCGRTGGGIPVSPFYIPCDGTVGNSPRNLFIGPGLAQWDMSLIKNTKITEKVSVEFRWEVFNILNRANFHYFPDNNVLSSCGSPLAGGGCDPQEHAFATFVKTSDVASGNPVIAQGGPRNMNFSLKFIF
jgi:hypothetical protein